MPTTQQTIGNQLRYPLDDPSGSFRSALTDIGINPYASNPFVAQLMKSAQGARAAFLTSRVNSQSNATLDSMPDPSADFGSWLRGQLGGGTLFNSMNQSAGNFDNTVKAMKEYEAGLAGGNATGASISPYAAALNDMMGNNNGMGALSTYASLRTPSLGALAPAWTQGVQNAGQSALNKYYQQGDANASPWDWLFPANRKSLF